MAFQVLEFMAVQCALVVLRHEVKKMYTGKSLHRFYKPHMPTAPCPCAMRRKHELWSQAELNSHLTWLLFPP